MRNVIFFILVAAMGVGCSTTTPVGSAHRHYFQHSFLNFETQPIYPRYFRVPEPLSNQSEPEVEYRTHREVVENLHRPAREQKANQDRRAPEVVAVTKAVPEERDEVAQQQQIESAGDLASLLGKTSVPAGPEPVTRENGVSLVRTEVVDSSKRLVGIKDDFTPERFLKHVLRVNGLKYVSFDGKEFNRTLYRELRNRGMTYDSATPQPGDIVFFHNTWDRNNDGRNNDWYTGTGIVTEIDEDTVVFVGVANGQVRELRMNLDKPDVRRMEEENAHLNSFMRSKRLSDPEYTQYLAGELFAGYASILQP